MAATQRTQEQKSAFIVKRVLHALQVHSDFWTRISQSQFEGETRGIGQGRPALHQTACYGRQLLGQDEGKPVMQDWEGQMAVQ